MFELHTKIGLRIAMLDVKINLCGRQFDKKLKIYNDLMSSGNELNWNPKNNIAQIWENEFKNKTMKEKIVKYNRALK